MAPASFHQNSSTVCVMDASGRLGSGLSSGYSKEAILFMLRFRTLLLSLNGLSCDNKKLKMFHSDPLDYHSIIDALRGCSGLFYAFEPPPDQLIYVELMAEVEVRAAHNVLEACAQTDTIDKVVFTSSATTVIWRDDRNSSSSSADLDEKHWSDINICRKFKLWHALSKTLVEKAAWALAMDRGVNMMCINAGMVVGLDMSVTNPYLKGAAEMYDEGVFVTVDLDFLINAHICVFEDVSAYGHYLCFNHVINRTQDAIKLAQMLTPVSPKHQSYEEDTRMIQQRISNKKLNKLMVDLKSRPHQEGMAFEKSTNR